MQATHGPSVPTKSWPFALVEPDPPPVERPPPTCELTRRLLSRDPLVRLAGLVDLLELCAEGNPRLEALRDRILAERGAQRLR